MALTLTKQAAILTLGNVLTRGLGFLLHLLLARWMGAEALGVMEMANSVGMLALTPVTAGIPSAMSRITAKRDADQQPAVLHAGQRIVLRMSLWLIPALLLLSPALAWLLGDMRTLPAIMLNAPDILLLGLCSVYCGYCYGQENTLLPAAAEVVEQTVRFVLSVSLVWCLRRASVGTLAALPGLAEAVAAVAVVIILRRALPVAARTVPRDRPLENQLFALSTPTTVSRLCLTGMRTLNAVLLPVCLRRSGLSAAAATAQFGLLSGMAMPLMMIPGVVTSALCMITTPAISRSEGSPRALRCTMRRLMLPALLIGLLSAAGLYFTADFICIHLYNTPALAPLVRFMCPMTLIFAVHQVQMGMITGLGLQKRSLTGTILSIAVTLVLTALLAPVPGLRLFGAAMASMLGHLTAMLWDALLLRRVRCQA